MLKTDMQPSTMVGADSPVQGTGSPPTLALPGVSASRVEFPPGSLGLDSDHEFLSENSVLRSGTKIHDGLSHRFFE